MAICYRPGVVLFCDECGRDLYMTVKPVGIDAFKQPSDVIVLDDRLPPPVMHERIKCYWCLGKKLVSDEEASTIRRRDDPAKPSQPSD